MTTGAAFDSNRARRAGWRERPFSTTILFLGSGVLGLGLTALTRIGELQRGLPLVTSHLADLIATAWITWVCASLGCLVVDRFRFLPAAMRAAIAVTVGLTFISTALLFSGLIGQIRTAAVAVVPLAAVFVCAVGTPAKALALFTATGRQIRDSLSSQLVVAAGISVVLVLTVLAAFQPVNDWDSLMYHLMLPSEWLEEGRIFLPDGNLHAAFVGVVQMMYIPMEVFDVRAGPALLQAVALVGTAVVVMDASRRHGGDLVGAIGGSLIVGSSALLAVAAIPRVDAWLVLVIAVVQLLVIEVAAGKREVRRLSILAGAISGVGLGIKYQALAYALPAGALLAFLAVRRRQSALGRGLFVGSTVGLLVAAPWLVKNVVLLGAPLYPFFTQRHTWEWVQSLAPHYEAAHHFRPLAELRRPFSILAWLLEPDSLSRQREGMLAGLHPMLGLAPLALATKRWRLALAALVLSMGGVAVVVVVSSTTNPRYLNPAFPGMAFAAALVVGGLVGRAQAPRQRTAIAIIVVIALLPGLIWAGLRVASGSLQFSVGLESAAMWSERPSNVDRARLESVDEWLMVEGAERTLLLLEARTDDFTSDVIQDVSASNWPHMWEALGGVCPRQAPFTHVLLNRGALTIFLSDGMSESANHWDKFGDFATRCLERVGNAHGYELFGLRGP